MSVPSNGAMCQVVLRVCCWWFSYGWQALLAEQRLHRFNTRLDARHARLHLPQAVKVVCCDLRKIGLFSIR